MILTKQQVREKLERFKNTATDSIIKNRKYCFLAKHFLSDYTEFQGIFEKLDESISFQIVNPNHTVFNQKEEINILFDSFSIKLLQKNNTFYFYCIAEYKLK